MTILKRAGHVFVGELPASTKPWTIRIYGGVMFVGNPEHGVFVVEGNQLRSVPFSMNESIS